MEPTFSHQIISETIIMKYNLSEQQIAEKQETMIIQIKHKTT